jgi:2-methylcitrate dehydratase PrpD
LLKLNIDQTVHALSNAWVLSPTMIGGTTDVSTGSMSKEGVAWAAQSGLQSAFLAKNGFVGPYLFVDEHDDLIADRLVDDLGNSWLVNSNYFKPYACCRWLHSTASACDMLLRNHASELKDITSIDVEIFGRAIELVSSAYPKNPVQAQFHVPFIIANMLLNGHVLPEHFTPENMGNPELKSLVKKVTLSEKKAYNILFPSKLPSAVTMQTKNNSYKKEVLKAPWGADCQPSDDELLAKFRMQAGDRKQFIWDAILSDKGIQTID